MSGARRAPGPGAWTGGPGGSRNWLCGNTQLSRGETGERSKGGLASDPAERCLRGWDAARCLCAAPSARLAGGHNLVPQLQ